MFKLISILSIWFSALCVPTAELNQPTNEQAPDRTAKIQVALLLDTSGSMDGLIEQAKSQLWKMVNELATSKKGGKAPAIELALYEYGKSSLPQGKGYLQQLVPLTTDLDLVSEKLFGLQTNGGDEYCGWVIQEATQNLKWSESNEDLKIIIIAGNEEFTQGTVDYKKACKGAITNGIVVNTIYCGDCEEGIRYWWKDGADRADGKYMCINQNDQVAHIETPYDKEISTLNDELNKTYIAFGSAGKDRQARQLKQDANADSYGMANKAERAISKSKKSTYNNAAWDAVDAVAEDEEFIVKLEEEQLPEEMKKMTMEERKNYVEEKAKEREEIQRKIQEAAKKRTAFITEKHKEAAGDEKNTLDAVMLKAVREQAEKQKFKFEK
ncbi:vWA domain-containing protein [Aureispira anguillae]|uniref:VWA domain-containing protein n=1 Tax=Aureispira anguillae TaxID=2864201 RepID=A0A915YM81_9BACT|nr:VWA domain-containing protein [Aureispira anguillae]BDS15378.1 VWA domain-containing protein [Aureispira anguillae]